MVKGNKLLLDLLFPRRCPVCDRITEGPGQMVCRDCRKKIVYITEPCCMKCGRQLKDQEKEYCRECEDSRHLYVRGTALYDYGSMSDSIFRFKYRGRAEYAEFYGRELFEKRGQWLQAVRPDALVPVPIHSSRKRQRGYNQAELVARKLSDLTGIPVNVSLICREKRTSPMKELGPAERQKNLKKAFKIRQNDVKLNTIVIIDDVYTTGSTIDAITHTVWNAGITEIYFMTLTIGRGI